ncbi:competence type IV pilus minor pilin ComGG [Mesobacillus subterraneus]|uniref:competence type IV pilus minor pilin ComGG n=1 Tax=Mesobacillus subterraneus TaxID=285983 RepID=UPI00273F544B|nr:competence type IV pilus minor pilin ComGG [Mesobacillus subterraneus]WLR57629.1 competence type IV pilus minor pilin ComGG [Mesobacillus subterraneus]
MIFLLLISFYLLILTENYLAGKRFANETETIRLQEYYMMCSVKQAATMLKEGNLPASGILTYELGNVAYQRQPLSVSLDEVTFNLNLDSGEKALGIGQYDKVTGAMVRWREKN